ncbi:uncharacterized protein [Diadema antillarum]|uniref:uncharacterized protein n=1 Tax=Diadema antillarum TaxID=105358 RepID=UPI003A891F71
MMSTCATSPEGGSHVTMVPNTYKTREQMFETAAGDGNGLTWGDTTTTIAEIVSRSPPIMPILLRCASTPSDPRLAEKIAEGDVVKIARLQPVDIVQARVEFKSSQERELRGMHEYNGVPLPSVLAMPKSLSTISFEVVRGSVRYAFNDLNDLNPSKLTSKSKQCMRFNSVEQISKHLPRFVKVIKTYKAIRQNTKVIEGHVLEVMGVHTPWTTKNKYLSCRIDEPDGQVCKLDLRWKGIFDALPDTKHYLIQDLLRMYRLPVVVRVRDFTPTDWMPQVTMSQLKACRTLDLNLTLDREVTAEYVLGIRDGNNSPSTLNVMVMSKNVKVDFVTSSDMTMNPKKYHHYMENLGIIGDPHVNSISKDIYASEYGSFLMTTVPVSKLKPRSLLLKPQASSLDKPEECDETSASAQKRKSCDYIAIDVNSSEGWNHASSDVNNDDEDDYESLASILSNHSDQEKGETDPLPGPGEASPNYTAMGYSLRGSSSGWHSQEMEQHHRAHRATGDRSHYQVPKPVHRSASCQDLPEVRGDDVRISTMTCAENMPIPPPLPGRPAAVADSCPAGTSPPIRPPLMRLKTLPFKTNPHLKDLSNCFADLKKRPTTNIDPESCSATPLIETNRRPADFQCGRSQNQAVFKIRPSIPPPPGPFENVWPMSPPPLDCLPPPPCDGDAINMADIPMADYPPPLPPRWPSEESIANLSTSSESLNSSHSSVDLRSVFEGVDKRITQHQRPTGHGSVTLDRSKSFTPGLPLHSTPYRQLPKLPLSRPDSKSSTLEFPLPGSFTLRIRENGSRPYSGDLLDEIRPPPPLPPCIGPRSSSCDNLLAVSGGNSRYEKHAGDANARITFSSNQTINEQSAPPVPDTPRPKLRYNHLHTPVATIIPRPSHPSVRKGRKSNPFGPVEGACTNAGDPETEAVEHESEDEYLAPVVKNPRPVPPPPIPALESVNVNTIVNEVSKSDDTECVHITSIRDIPRDISCLTCEQVAQALALLKVQDRVIEAFLENQMNGALLQSMPQDILENTFHMSPFHAIKVIKFVNGWRP